MSDPYAGYPYAAAGQAGPHAAPQQAAKPLVVSVAGSLVILVGVLLAVTTLYRFGTLGVDDLAEVDPNAVSELQASGIDESGFRSIMLACAGGCGFVAVSLAVLLGVFSMRARLWAMVTALVLAALVALWQGVESLALLVMQGEGPVPGGAAAIALSGLTALAAAATVVALIWAIVVRPNPDDLQAAQYAAAWQQYAAQQQAWQQHQQAQPPQPPPANDAGEGESSQRGDQAGWG